MRNRGSRRAITLLAATLAATIILAILARCSSGSREAASQPGVAANVISPHLPFGNPSDAGGDPNNRLALRPQFAASWNASKRIANWVAWRLRASDIGDTERSQFYSDPEVDTPAPKDYTNSGYDRGHMCPSKDRSDSPENNRGVFTMVNILPQSPAWESVRFRGVMQPPVAEGGCMTPRNLMLSYQVCTRTLVRPFRECLEAYGVTWPKCWAFRFRESLTLSQTRHRLRSGRRTSITTRSFTK